MPLANRVFVAGVFGAALASVVAVPSVQAQQSYLVWTAGGKGLGQTQLVELGAAGPKVTASGAGLVVAMPGRVWAVREAMMAVPLLRCACLTAAQRDRYDPDRPPAHCVSQVKRKALHLVDAQTGTSRVLVRPPNLLTQDEGTAGWSAEMLGQVGPYLLAASYSWESPCQAAHGGSSASFVALDLVSGQPVDIWAKGEQAELVRVGGAKAMAALSAAMRKQGLDGKVEATMANTLAVQALFPAWDAAGQLSPRYLFVLGWDYASGDNLWGSYSRSVWVQVPYAISRLQGQPLLPQAVRHQLALQTQARRFGWSAVQPAQLGLVRRELVTPTPVSTAKPATAGPSVPKPTGGQPARPTNGARAQPSHSLRAPR